MARNLFVILCALSSVLAAPNPAVYTMAKSANSGKIDSFMLDKICRGKAVKKILDNGEIIRCDHHRSHHECPSESVLLSNGTCVPNFQIALRDKSSNAYGWKNCNPIIASIVPGLMIEGSKPSACTFVVTAASTHSMAVQLEGDALTTYITADPQTGQVYFTGGPKQVIPCELFSEDDSGQGDNETMESAPFIQTYAVQCIDSRGIVSATSPTFQLTFPSCDVRANCAVDGTCATCPNPTK